MIFDPTKEIDFYQKFAREKGCRIVKTFETHLQADYISGSPGIAGQTGAVLMAHENDFSGAAFFYQAIQDGNAHHFTNGGPEVYAKIRQVNAGRLEVDLDEQNVMDLGKNECAASAAKD